MNKDLQLIADYLRDKLSSGERDAFEDRLNTDTAFAEAFQLEKSMNAFLVKENKKDQLIPKLEELGKKHFENAAKNEVNPNREAKTLSMGRRRWMTGLAIAASLLFLFVLSQLDWGTQNLYDQYAMHQAINLTEKSDNDANAVQAQKLFNEQKYAEAKKYLGPYLENTPGDTKALLAWGICAMETGDYNVAQSTFSAIQSGQTALKNTANWYLGLLYLKQENFEKAKGYFASVPESEGQLYQQAQDILKQLDQ